MRLRTTALPLLLAAGLLVGCADALDDATTGTTADAGDADDTDGGTTDEGGARASDDDGAPATLESEELLGALQEVTRLAPALESFYRGAPYPTGLDEVLASLPDAGLTVTDGYAVRGYRYDPDAIEFTLCVEHEATGAWATYDTAPMSTQENGESGGCPAL